jgi:hypothetical protein
MSTGYSHDYEVDPYVVLTIAGGGVPSYGYWVQLYDNGITGFIQSVRLAV